MACLMWSKCHIWMASSFSLLMEGILKIMSFCVYVDTLCWIFSFFLRGFFDQFLYCWSVSLWLWTKIIFRQEICKISMLTSFAYIQFFMILFWLGKVLNNLHECCREFKWIYKWFTWVLHLDFLDVDWL